MILFPRRNGVAIPRLPTNENLWGIHRNGRLLYLALGSP